MAVAIGLSASQLAVGSAKSPSAAGWLGLGWQGPRAPSTTTSNPSNKVTSKGRRSPSFASIRLRRPAGALRRPFCPCLCFWAMANGPMTDSCVLSLVLLSLVHMISTLVNRGRTRQKETEQAHQQECTPTEDKTKRHRASTANKRQLADRQGRLGAEPAMKRMCLYCSPEPGHPDRSSRRRRLRHRPRHRRLVPLPLR